MANLNVTFQTLWTGLQSQYISDVGLPLYLAVKPLSQEEGEQHLKFRTNNIIIWQQKFAAWMGRAELGLEQESTLVFDCDSSYVISLLTSIK